MPSSLKCLYRTSAARTLTRIRLDRCARRPTSAANCPATFRARRPNGRSRRRRAQHPPGTATVSTGRLVASATVAIQAVTSRATTAGHDPIGLEHWPGRACAAPRTRSPRRQPARVPRRRTRCPDRTGWSAACGPRTVCARLGRTATRSGRYWGSPSHNSRRTPAQDRGVESHATADGPSPRTGRRRCWDRRRGSALRSYWGS